MPSWTSGIQPGGAGSDRPSPADARLTYNLPVSWGSCYSAATASEAHLVKGFLEHRGVPCVLESDGLTVYPSAVMGLGVQVLVPEDWLPVARKLVAGRKAARGTRRGRVVRMPRRSGS